VSYGRIFQLVFVASVGIFIMVLMWALFENARTRGLPDPFQYVFYAAGFVIFVFIVPKILKREE
jgi:hypothetical protein